MKSSSLTSKGQITIPHELREALQLHPGDRLGFELVDDKILIFKKTTDISHAFGMYKINKKITDADIQKSIEKGYVDDSD